MPPKPRFPSRRTLAPQPAPPGLYASTYDPELGAAICRRMAAGESLRTICAAPSMPTGKTVWNWARAHEEFRMMKAHALSVARARSLAAQDARELDRWITFGGPRGRTGRPSGYGPEVAEAICRRLVVGESLTSICRDPAMPSIGTVYNWMRRYPEFVEDVRRMKVGLEDTVCELACADLPWLGERKSWPMLRRTVKAAGRAARRVSLKRYAPPSGPTALTVVLEDGAGERVIYGAERSSPEESTSGERRRASRRSASPRPTRAGTSPGR